MANRVHFQIPEGQFFASQGRAHPAQHRFHPRDQFARTERLGDIVIGAGFETADLVFFLTACGQHDDRDIGGFRRASQAAADFDPGQAFQHPVEQDHIRSVFLNQQQRFLAIRRMDHVIFLFLEVPAQQFGKRGVIFNKQ